MSGITSSIGLMSGIDSADLIEQLMAIEAQPVTRLEEQISAIDIQRTAFLDLSARILALQGVAQQFESLSLFRGFGTTSSNESVLMAQADDGAAAGAYTFRVHSLATNHSVVSRGFADADRMPVGVGTISLEVGQGRVNRGTELSTLNSGQGVARGTIAITDRSGAMAEIDLSTATTVEDVLEAINRENSINVRARVTGLASAGATGDRIVLEDLTSDAAITGDLIVADRNGGTTASDLGIVASSATGRIDGRDLVRLSSGTQLDLLNDGNGVGVGGILDNALTFVKSGANPESFTASFSDTIKLDTDLRVLNGGQGVRLGVMRITDRSGASVDVDFSDLDLEDGVTVRDIRDRITTAANSAGVSISFTSVNSYFQITDTTDVHEDLEGNLIVEDLTGHTAADLGMAGDVDDDSIRGSDVYRVATVGDVINAINYAAGNNGQIARAAIAEDGNGITLTAMEYGTTVTVDAGDNEALAEELGLLGASFSEADGPFESRQLIAGLNTVLLQSLRGGQGVDLGEIRLTDRMNRTTTIDFGGADTPIRTLQDVVDFINADSSTSLVASINSAGNGIELSDNSNDNGTITVADVGDSSMAAQLGLAGTHDPAAGGVVNGGNLQLQYITRSTALADLNSGQGVTLGDFQITDSTGQTHTVRLGSKVETVGDVISAINLVAPDSIEARINDTGDGILIEDKTDGTQKLTVADINGGQAAAGLRLAGTARTGESFIDGSFEVRVEVGPADTLDDIAQRLNEAGVGLSASILNNGGAANPYSLTITSTQSGRAGELVIDSGGLDLGLRTMTKAQDTLVFVGDESGGAPLLISSANTTLENVIEGVTIDVLAAADEDVTVTVSQDVDGIVDTISRFVEKYNDVQAAIDDAVYFDEESLERGALMGDSTVNTIRNRLSRIMLGSFNEAGSSVSHLTAVGIRLTSGNRLEFDEERFREVYEDSPEQVERLFTAEDTGFGAVITGALEALTDSYDGLITHKDNLLVEKQDLLNDRIDRLEVLLSAKQARLEAQFAGLESSLAVLQGQQDALTALAQLASDA